MKHFKLVILLISIMVIVNDTAIMAGNILSEPMKIKDLFGFDDNLEVIIDEVSYEKYSIDEKDRGDAVAIKAEELKNMFLNNAVVINFTISEALYRYEKVFVKGSLKDGKKVYRFEYNLGGYGGIFLSDNDYLPFGDITKRIDPKTY